MARQCSGEKPLEMNEEYAREYLRDERPADLFIRFLLSVTVGLVKIKDRWDVRESERCASLRLISLLDLQDGMSGRRTGKRIASSRRVRADAEAGELTVGVHQGGPCALWLNSEVIHHWASGRGRKLRCARPMYPSIWTMPRSAYDGGDEFLLLPIPAKDRWRVSPMISSDGRLMPLRPGRLHFEVRSPHGTEYLRASERTFIGMYEEFRNALETGIRGHRRRDAMA